jgi:nucleoside-diphosphate-sugar epimerase
MKQKTALVLGAGGFIGSHLVKRLKEEEYWVRGVDLKYPEHWDTYADEFVIGDLRNPLLVSKIMTGPKQNIISPNYIDSFDEVYQLAADMGGAGYIFTGENDANVMHNSAQINLNIAHEATLKKIKRIFYSSSACMYPAYNQEDPTNPRCSEDSAYPAAPDSEYGWEKLFSERLYLAFNRNYKLDVRIARYHNIFGPYGTWRGGKEKAPAALCRKVIETSYNGVIEVWGDGKQTRSFLYIDDCIDATLKLMRNDSFLGPVNIGSEEMISINDYAKMIIGISGKNINIKNIPGPEGVRGRNSDNKLIEEKLKWRPQYNLYQGTLKLYNWINSIDYTIKTVDSSNLSSNV